MERGCQLAISAGCRVVNKGRWPFGGGRLPRAEIDDRPVRQVASPRVVVPAIGELEVDTPPARVIHSGSSQTPSAVPRRVIYHVKNRDDPARTRLPGRRGSVAFRRDAGRRVCQDRTYPVADERQHHIVRQQAIVSGHLCFNGHAPVLTQAEAGVADLHLLTSQAIEKRAAETRSSLRA